MKVVYGLGAVLWFLAALDVATEGVPLNVVTSFIACLFSASFFLGLVLLGD